ncbi:N-acetylmuramoyl-L-alanine amidase [uncultured Thiocystis sp.]|uniref:N-acetylmuramoyl-L-alanine amidase family protein n=1 Tax=uncultured Thiocystis sp. TaxID=1202134 RepID=UPI0025E946B8|nr:N-acetylmuramoyl-L-alanine amidase [uncultured Thiocystis sp.]
MALTVAATLALAHPGLVAIDVGHTRHAPGAISARGVAEFEFNRTLANALDEALASEPGLQPVIINAPDFALGLTARVARAKALGAVLFVSIHHDSVQPSYLTPVHQAGRIHHVSRYASGYSLFVSQRQACCPVGSRHLAERLGEALQVAGYQASGHHAEDIPGERRRWIDPALGIYRFDGLAVLRQAAMPAVLIEAGVIVHPEQEVELASAAGQRRMARALAAGIIAWWRETRD